MTNYNSGNQTINTSINNKRNSISGGNPAIHPIHNRKYILLSKFQESNHKGGESGFSSPANYSNLSTSRNIKVKFNIENSFLTSLNINDKGDVKNIHLQNTK